MSQELDLRELRERLAGYRRLPMQPIEHVAGYVAVFDPLTVHCLIERLEAAERALHHHEEWRAGFLAGLLAVEELFHDKAQRWVKASDDARVGTDGRGCPDTVVVAGVCRIVADALYGVASAVPYLPVPGDKAEEKA